MSRCFPYPTAYSLKVANDEALIESIKLQKEREKAKTELKKERKREKKEKKRERKEKSKHIPSEVDCDKEKKFLDVKLHKGEKSRLDFEGTHGKRKREDEAEQHEISDITEEHAQPVYSQAPCNSSESTQNSNKRRRNDSPSSGSHSHGNIIRIRLSSQKRKEHDVSASREGPTSSSAKIVGQAKNDLAYGCSQERFPSALIGRESCLPDASFTTVEEPKCSTSGRAEIFAQDPPCAASMSSSSESGIQKLSSLYEGLAKNWVQLPLQNVNIDVDNQEWLFSSKRREIPKEKSFESISNVGCRGSSSLWPCAQYLPDCDVFALPFTIPF